MKVRFIDKFEGVLLDMGRTFMFDIDRFSDSEDYEATYRLLGGDKLTAGQLRRIVSAVFDKMASDARNPSCYERFPSVVRYIRTIPEAQKLSDGEIVLLEQVFATHEVGTVPDIYAEVLHRLHKTHRLGIVSDIWSKSDLYFKELERARICELFEVIVFSSDHGRLKPSTYPFTKAIEALNVERSRLYMSETVSGAISREQKQRGYRRSGSAMAQAGLMIALPLTDIENHRGFSHRQLVPEYSLSYL